MNCAAERRARIQAAADAVDRQPAVVATDVLGPGAGPRDAWSLELTLTTDAAPPAVLRALALNRLRALEIQPCGSGLRVVAELHPTAITNAGP